MMGAKLRVFTPLTDLSLESLVPADHFYRHLDRTLDLSFVRDLVANCYAAGGRPSVDPIVFFKLQQVLFFEGIRSERQLMSVVADRLSLRWYLGYDLDERLPDHSSLTKIRERYGLPVFRRFFETITTRCVTAGLVWGKELYVDATKVEANAARSSLVPRFAIEPHLRDLFELDAPTNLEDLTANDTGDRHTADVEALPLVLPVSISAEQRVALVSTNTRRHDWLAAAGKQQREVQHHFRKRLADYVVSTTDPDATFMHRPGSSTRLGYQTHYVVDGGKARIILQALVAPAAACNQCPCKARCTPSNAGRTVQRSLDEEYLDRVRGYHESAAYKKAMHKRGVWVEPLFAEAKGWHGLRRFRLRGLQKVNGEALLTASGQNLKRLLSRCGWGRRPYPGGALGLAINPAFVGVVG